MGFIVYDEDFRRDGFVGLEIKRVFVGGFILTVCDVLGVVICF